MNIFGGMMKLWIFLGGHHKAELFWGSSIYISELGYARCSRFFLLLFFLYFFFLGGGGGGKQ